VGKVNNLAPGTARAERGGDDWAGQPTAVSVPQYSRRSRQAAHALVPEFDSGQRSGAKIKKLSGGYCHDVSGR
jgi:hypothetical protein